MLNCHKCNRSFRGEKCYSNHLKKKAGEKYTICQRLSICRKCFTFVDQQQLERLHEISKRRETESVNGITSVFSPNVKHICTESWCNYCAQYVSTAPRHYCNLTPYTRSSPDKYIIIFFDFETVQTKPVSLIASQKNDIQYLHEPILVCAQRICELCVNHNELNHRCLMCRKRRWTFEGKNCVEKFLKWIVNINVRGREIVCLSHNGAMYDNVILLRGLLNTTMNFNNIDLIQNGHKIIKMTLKNYIHFIDSLSFLPMALDKFQKEFNLDENLSKGFFPYLFLSFDRWRYDGEFPDKKYFGMETSTNKERVAEFNVWHDAQPRVGYKIRNEAIKYCTNDVTILRLGCLHFMREILNLADINPFFQCVTLAQLSLTIYRKRFMPKDTLGIVPPDNFHSNTNQSKICRKWLTYLNFFQPQTLAQQSMIRAEHRLPEGIYVDGYHESSDGVKTVYEFSGCYFHGCPQCIQQNPFQMKQHTVYRRSLIQRAQTIAPANDEQFDGMDIERTDRAIMTNQNFQRTRAKLNFLRLHSYKVVHMWEHTFVKFLKENPDLDKQISNHSYFQQTKLIARDGMYGGRNEAGMLYYKVKNNEQIHFVDFNSLYPYAMLTGKYFVGAPQRIWLFSECDNLTAQDIDKMDGLAYVSILPNQKLYWPVLPFRTNGKLLFGSCRTCMIDENVVSTECKIHNIQERQITAVFSLCEIKVALKRGYKLLKIFEIWQYRSVQGRIVEMASEDMPKYDELLDRYENDLLNDPIENGIFTRYIKRILQIKIEASGWPHDCVTDALKKAYIVEIFRKNGVLLKWDQIRKNPGRRLMAKLLLNALYGKLCQKPRLIQTIILQNHQDLIFYLNSDMHEVTDIYCPNEKYAILTFKMKQASDDGQPIVISPLKPTYEQKHICITTGIQTTATARLYLYNELERLNERVIYLDTDSLVYTVDLDKNEYMPKLSSAVGGLVSELERFRKHANFTPYIDEIVVISPKTYCYSVISEDPTTENFEKDYVVKCKGLRVTSENARLINMEVMKAFALGPEYSKYANEISGLEGDMWIYDEILTERRAIKNLKHYNTVTAIERKIMKFTYAKRRVTENCRTLPYGYRNT